MPEVIQLSPSEVRYSQSSISSKFTDGTNLGEVLEDIIVGRCFVSGLPKIKVVRQNGEWTTVDNRRLWIYKQLEYLERCHKIDVIVKKKLPPGRNTTKTGGASIRIRGQVTTRSGCVLSLTDGDNAEKDGGKDETNPENVDSPPSQPAKPKKKTRRRRPRKHKSKQVDVDNVAGSATAKGETRSDSDVVPVSDNVVDSAAARDVTGSNSDSSAESGFERYEENDEDGSERCEQDTFKMYMEMWKSLNDLRESIDDHMKYPMDQLFDNGLESDITSSEDEDDSTEEEAVFGKPNTTRQSHSQIPESTPYYKVHNTSNRTIDQGYSSNSYRSGCVSTDQGYSSNSYRSGRLSPDQEYSSNSFRSGRLSTDQGYSSNTYRSGRLSTDQGYSSNSYRSGRVSTDQGYSSNSIRSGRLSPDQEYSSNSYRSGRLSTDQGYSSNTYRSGSLSTDQGYSSNSYIRRQATHNSSPGLVKNTFQSLYGFDYARYGVLDSDPSFEMAASVVAAKHHQNTGRPRTSYSSTNLGRHTYADQRCDVTVERPETDHYRVNQRLFPVPEDKKSENNSWCAIL